MYREYKPNYRDYYGLNEETKPFPDARMKEITKMVPTKKPLPAPLHTNSWDLKRAAALFQDIQSFSEHYQELVELCALSLEEAHLKGKENESLKEEVVTLGKENEELRLRLSRPQLVSAPAVVIPKEIPVPHVARLVEDLMRNGSLTKADKDIVGHLKDRCLSQVTGAIKRDEIFDKLKSANSGLKKIFIANYSFREECNNWLFEIAPSPAHAD